MNFVSKAAALAAATAISATGLVAATGTMADAATVSVTYDCDLTSFGIPAGGPSQITAAYTVPALSSPIPQGAAVPSQAVSGAITVSPEVSTLISGVGADGGKLSGSVKGDVAFGSQKVAASLTIQPQAVTPASSSTVQANGTLAGFTASQAGAQAVALPGVVTATLNSVIGPAAVTCNAASGSNLSLGSVDVLAPSLAVKAPKSVKAGHVAKLKVTTTATGKAVAKIKGKKVATAKVKDNGKATLKVKKGLKKGKNKIVVSVGSLKQTVKVKVK